MIALDKIVSLKTYVVVVGNALTLSEHDRLSEAKSACARGTKDGFVGVAILKRTPEGWIER